MLQASFEERAEGRSAGWVRCGNGHCNPPLAVEPDLTLHSTDTCLSTQRTTMVKLACAPPLWVWHKTMWGQTTSICSSPWACSELACKVEKTLLPHVTSAHAWLLLPELCSMNMMMPSLSIRWKMGSALSQVYVELLMHALHQKLTVCSSAQFYVPVIPLCLVNGSEGIGTGFSSSVPNYNPRDIIRNLRHMIEGEEPVGLASTLLV